MLEFLMYELEKLLPEDQFRGIISDFSIGTAQLWVERVKDLIGLSRYCEIKEKFISQQEQERKKLLEMNCFHTRKASRNRETIFQADIGADKHAKVDGESVDRLFTSLFAGV